MEVDGAPPEESLGLPDDASLKAWVALAAQTCVVLKIETIQHVGKDVEKMAVALSKATPRTDPIVNNEVYLRGAAAKSLLNGWKGREAFACSSVNLFRAMTKMNALMTEYALPVKIEEICNDVVMMSRTIFNESRRVISIVAGCNVCQNMAGKEQRDEAELIISKPGQALPAALVAALQAVLKEPVKGKKRKAQ